MRRLQICFFNKFQTSVIPAQMYFVRANTENGNITAPPGFEKRNTEIIPQHSLSLTMEPNV
jgi:hypothetical protein